MKAVNDTLNVPREIPKPRSYSAAFWRGSREERLLVQYDPRCGKYQFYPRPTSIYDGRRGLEWREVSGEGAIFSFTIVRRAPPPFRGSEPFVIAVVSLDVGVNVMSNIVHCDLERLSIGLRVRPFWAPLSNGDNLLLFQPDPLQ